MKRHQLDGNVGNGGGIGSKAPSEAIEIGQSAGVERGVDGGGKFGLAGAIMGERQQPDHGAARAFLAVCGEQRFERAPIRTPRKELSR